MSLIAPPDDAVPEVNLAPPDLSPWRAGNAGIPGFITLTGPAPGPHLGVVSLMHGNEFSGAIALDRLLRRGLSPLRGTLSIGFANLDAFDRFDPAHPTAARFIEEDLNRVWDADGLASGSPDTIERRRARQMLPLLTRFDLLLDLHSMLWPADPLMLVSPHSHGSQLADRLGAPYVVVADPGHASGPRLIDHPHFTSGNPGGARAVLIEAGLHWQPETVRIAEIAILNLLASLEMIAVTPEVIRWPVPLAPSPLHAEVTVSITARTRSFAFQDRYRGGMVIPHAGTLIARDAEREIRTPYDSCLMVMPSLRPSPGHTAVRLARFTS